MPRAKQLKFGDRDQIDSNSWSPEQKFGQVNVCAGENSTLNSSDRRKNKLSKFHEFWNCIKKKLEECLLFSVKTN